MNNVVFVGLAGLVESGFDETVSSRLDKVVVDVGHCVDGGATVAGST